MGTTGRQRRRAGGSLTWRTVTVSALLSAVVGATFFVLALAIGILQHSESRANRALELVAASNHLERTVFQVETAQRGYIITTGAQFLSGWRDARAGFERQAVALQHLARSAEPDQRIRAEHIGTASQAYVNGYTVPLMAIAQRNPDSARTVAVTEEGARQVHALRLMFAQFMAREQQIFSQRHTLADAAANRGLAAASASVAGSILLILLSGGYLARSVVRPVRAVSEMAGRVAGGDLSARMPETGPGEVGGLERSFNRMTDSLEASRDELREAADQQDALRQVATLVAQGISPPDLFSAVAAETGRVLASEATAVLRFEADGTATVAGYWHRPGSAGPPLTLGSNWLAEEDSVAARVQRTGKPAGVTSYDSLAGPGTEWAREHGTRSSVGSPIVVEGQLWGVIIALSGAFAAQDDDSQARLAGFTDLVAMAIANSDSRAQLAASRARVVVSADQTRRRIERDLHDGAQQRLVSLALELRAAESQLPLAEKTQAEQWSRTAQGLTDVIEELREISRGLHPAILEEGGLRPALRALTRRAGLPADLTARIPQRLQPQIEVAAYYVVSEALANAAKHAHASRVDIEVDVTGDVLRLLVRDDGVGGADKSRGSGLIGLADRVEALGGTLEITSPSGRGTSLLANIPLGRPK